jgi:Type IV secretion system pilin
MQFIILAIVLIAGLSGSLFATAAWLDSADTINLRNITIGTNTSTSNSVLDGFIKPIENFFFTPDAGSDGIQNIFITIAFQLKNFFIIVAVIFLIIGVMKLLFSDASEEKVKVWRQNIIWVSVGIFIMQIAFSIWRTLLISDSTVVGSVLAFAFWRQVLFPIIGILQMLASFGFLFMMVYAFYTRVSSAWEEEKYKKANNTIIYALFGFLLIKLPEAIVRSIYGSPACANNGIFQIGTCVLEKQNLTGSIGIIGKVITYINSFLALIAVILVIYAGWLILISAGDDEKLKKAKSIILYVFIGFLVIIASHALFKFFILQN